MPGVAPRTRARCRRRHRPRHDEREPPRCVARAARLAKAAATPPRAGLGLGRRGGGRGRRSRGVVLENRREAGAPGAVARRGRSAPFLFRRRQGTRVPLLAALAIASARATAGACALAAGFLTKKRLDGITGRSAPTSLAASSISNRPRRPRPSLSHENRSRKPRSVRCATSRFGWSARRSRRARHGRGGVVGHGAVRPAGERRETGAVARGGPAVRGRRRARASVCGFPILLANQTSLDALNALLKAKNVAPVPMNRFRPNVVVGEAIGGGRVDAWAEDAWGRVTLTGKDARAARPASGSTSSSRARGA